MRNDTTQHVDLATRLKDLEHFTRPLVGRPPDDTAAIPLQEPPARRVPSPRRSRVFLRHGGGHGVFAEMTLTAPRPRSTGS